MIPDVLVAGLVNRYEDGRSAARRRFKPEEQRDPISGLDPWQAADCAWPAYVEVDAAPSVAPSWVALLGTLLLDSSGMGSPVISVTDVRPYPKTGRDKWDEWRLERSGHPLFELSSVTLKSDGIWDRLDGIRTPADLDAHAAAVDDINRSPLCENSGLGFGLVPGYGFVTSVSVGFITDEFRAWLRATEHRVAAFPLVRRPA